MNKKCSTFEGQPLIASEESQANTTETEMHTICNQVLVNL